MEARTQTIKTVCVFGGSNPGKDRGYMEVANKFGNLLAARNIKLVYGGGNSGLPWCVACSAHSNNGKMLGIIPHNLAERNSGNPILGDELKVPSMHERIATMLHNADAFVALPGGFGTLEEIFCIISWAQKGLHKKPIGLLNVNGFYNGLMSFLNHCFVHEFIKPTANLIISSPDPEQVIDLMEVYASQLDPHLRQVNNEVTDKGNNNNNKEEELETILTL